MRSALDGVCRDLQVLRRRQESSEHRLRHLQVVLLEHGLGLEGGYLCVVMESFDVLMMDWLGDLKTWTQPRHPQSLMRAVEPLLDLVIVRVAVECFLALSVQCYLLSMVDVREV